MVNWSKAGKKAWETRKRNQVTELLNDKEFMETLKTVQSMRLHKNYVKSLEKHVGSTAAYLEKLYTDIASKMKGITFNNVVLNPGATKQFLTARCGAEKQAGDRRSVCTIWSDQHFGANVSSQEMAGTNEYNWTIAARRLGLICEETATYKESRRKYHDELVIFLLGDTIGGIIHNQEGPNYDLLINQIAGATDYLIQALNYMKSRGLFPKIRVYCQPGNHGRAMHKQDKGRALVNKFDSLENIVFYNLSLAYKDDPIVSIHITKAPFCDVEVQGHRIFGTHGDTLFTVGNIGSTINNRAIETRVANINATEREAGHKPYSLFVVAHGHHAAITTTSSGVKVIFNSSLIGSDAFAQGVGIVGNSPSQHLWETTPKYVFGDNRFLEAKAADKIENFEAIIRPYSGGICA